VIGILVAAALSGAVPSHVSHMSKRGESYARVRTKLLKLGWRPRETHYRLGDGTLAKEFGDAGDMLDAGFKEIYDCSGTGWNFCTFIWKRANRCIHVVTYGEYFPKRGAPKIWKVKRGSCSSDY
jgi:hypothetical protein